MSIKFFVLYAALGMVSFVAGWYFAALLVWAM